MAKQAQIPLAAVIKPFADIPPNEVRMNKTDSVVYLTTPKWPRQAFVLCYAKLQESGLNVYVKIPGQTIRL